MVTIPARSPEQSIGPSGLTWDERCFLIATMACRRSCANFARCVATSNVSGLHQSMAQYNHRCGALLINDLARSLHNCRAFRNGMSLRRANGGNRQRPPRRRLASLGKDDEIEKLLADIKARRAE